MCRREGASTRSQESSTAGKRLENSALYINLEGEKKKKKKPEKPMRAVENAASLLPGGMGSSKPW